ncbi:chromosome 9 open reading frame 117 [Nesidiocoris tenuis]|uniref:Cilia- and flagella-associated protein 157 n=1 Tax=Nesidiocoris tenuis TaxID=355587 RepID=A0ABN7AQE8_9HEMI|nr:chromosome 9 open reading frame 117 [Nesidiocoris tenuis]
MGKKGKGNKKKKDKEVKDTLPEVDKEYYEIQIADLNKKLSRLKTFMVKLEEENTNLKSELQQVERDRADVIAYLKRRLGEKSEEITELLERNHALVEEKKAENESFQELLASKDQEFKEVHDQLSAEIKLLNGKLSSLEEFREQKESLTAKYCQLEDKLRMTEEKAQEMEKEYEKANLINKDRLRQEMEEKLLQLSLDFQRVTQTKIDSTTQRVIKENIQISNELSKLLKSWHNLHQENENLRDQTRHIKIELSTEKSMVRRIMEKNVSLTQAMERLGEVTHQLENYGLEKEHLLGMIRDLQKREIELEESLKYSQDDVNRLLLVKHNQKAQIKKIEEEYCSINKQAMLCFKEIKLVSS